jgi:hypothetical protein
MRKSLIVMLALGLLGWGAVEQATAQLLNDATHATAGQDGSVTVLTVPNTAAQVGAGIDFVHAQPMKRPSVPARSGAWAQEDLIRGSRRDAAMRRKKIPLHRTRNDCIACSYSAETSTSARSRSMARCL